jgi:hypothetical protein
MLKYRSLSPAATPHDDDNDDDDMTDDVKHDGVRTRDNAASSLLVSVAPASAASRAPRVDGDDDTRCSDRVDDLATLADEAPVRALLPTGGSVDADGEAAMPPPLPPPPPPRPPPRRPPPPPPPNSTVNGDPSRTLPSSNDCTDGTITTLSMVRIDGAAATDAGGRG